jgi:hypothetical protein
LVRIAESAFVSNDARSLGHFLEVAARQTQGDRVMDLQRFIARAYLQPGPRFALQNKLVLTLRRLISKGVGFRDIESGPQLAASLRTHGVAPEVIGAAASLWRQYENWTFKNAERWGDAQ